MQNNRTEINQALQEAFTHYRKGNLQAAKDIYEEILKIQPDNVNALHFLGLVFFQMGEHDSAITYISKALTLGPGYAEAHNNLGIVLQDAGRPDSAVASYLKALSINPHLCSAYLNLGKIFLKKGSPDEAISYYRKAVQCDPSNAGAQYDLGLLLQEKGMFDEAMSCYRKAVRADPDFFPAYHMLGIGYHNMGKIDDAVAHHEKAVRLKPDIPAFYYNLGVALQEKCRLDEAVSYYRQAIRLKPDFAEAHLNISLIQLLTGNFRDGWKGYEWRWKTEAFKRPGFSKPLWDGSDIRGLSILIHAEQGLGDTLQFIRYVPLVAQRGARVIVECQRELLSLLKSVEGITQILAQGDPLPDFDLHCPLLSLPLIFDTTLETIPANIPYITADPLLVREWKARVSGDGSRLKVGLVWSGKPRHQRVRYRSYRLSSFAPPAHLGDVAFYSLQKGAESEQAKAPPEGMKLIDYTDEINDFSDTAALVENLDLIIAVETSVAHLAGAMGKPVWTLIPFIPDWRWLLNREDSPWYPTMKLFRQSTYGDMESVPVKIVQELTSMATKSNRRQ